MTLLFLDLDVWSRGGDTRYLGERWYTIVKGIRGQLRRFLSVCEVGMRYEGNLSYGIEGWKGI